MNRKALLIIVGALLVLAIVTLWISRNGLRPPRFVPGSPASLASFKWNEYQWLAEVPFQNGKMWMWTAVAPGTNWHVYLYDLRQRTVAGELFNAEVPEICSRNGSRILVKGLGSTEPPAEMMANAVRKMFGAAPLGSGARIDTFWMLDLTNHSAKKIGAITYSRGIGSVWDSSPDFRYGYTDPGGGLTYLCDFNRRSLTWISIHGYPVGWWDERDILIDTLKDELELFNVDTRTTRILFSAADIKTFFARSGITNAPNDIYPIPNWNGTNYDFYFGPKNKARGLHGDGFLAKANRSGPSLELVDPNFGYRWGAVFDRSATHYLFPGESGTPGRSADGAVYLRDVADGKITTVVPPDNKGQYSIPRFYGNEVIYFRDRVLHRAGLDGSNDTLLLTNSSQPSQVDKTSK